MPVRRLARNLAVDISATGVDGTWLRMPGRVDNNLTFAPNLVDATDTDTQGFGSKEVTLQNGSTVVKYNRLSSSGTPNAAHELIESCEGQFGDEIRLWVRVYDLDGGTRGWKYQAIVTIAATSTGVADLSQFTVTFDMDGDTVTRMSPSDISTAIGAATDPVVTSALPSAASVGNLLTITGTNFTGTTGVTIGGVAATHFAVVSDSKIVATVPAGSAGSAPVIVTNGTGPSAAFPYTRGA